MNDAVDSWKRRATPGGVMGPLLAVGRSASRRIDALETRSALESAAISKGGLRIRDGGLLTVMDGGNVVVQDGGDVQVRDGGTLAAYYPNGQQAMGFGPLAGNWWGLLVYDDAARDVLRAYYDAGAGGRYVYVGHEVNPVDRFTAWAATVTMRSDAFYVQTTDGTTRLSIGATDASVTSAGTLTMRSTGGPVILAAEAGQVNILQDTGSEQWMIGRSASVAAASRSYVWSPPNTNDVIVGGDLIAPTLSVSGSKSFRMPHPTKPGLDLMHGSTESPVSGVEYWGEGVIGEDGTVVVALPEYFEALVKPAGRVVLVTPIGAPSLLGADRIVGGAFTVHGEPGAEFSWLVKGERFGGDFELEPPTLHREPEFPPPEPFDTTTEED